MKGRSSFTLDEIQAIEHMLRQVQRAGAGRRKSLVDRLRRRYRFYVSDFADRHARRVTAEDVETLVSQGVIRVRARR